jgi:hypothetical protein
MRSRCGLLDILDKGSQKKSANELINVTLAQPNLNIVPAAHIYFGEDILKSSVPVLVVDIVHTARDIEERNHLFNILIDHKRMSLAGRLKNVIPGARDPIVLEIAPGALEDVAMNGSWMPVPAENSRAANTKQIAPLAVEGVQHERTEPHVRGLGHPNSFIVRDTLRDDLLRRQGMRGLHGTFISNSKKRSSRHPLEERLPL